METCGNDDVDQIDLDDQSNMVFNQDFVESIAVSSPKLSNRETELNSRHISDLTAAEKPIPSPKFNSSYNFSETFMEPVDDEGSDNNSTWEFHTVNLSRVPGYGFGIAVSGGRDNPHFKSGDPSIVISDVLRAGPAWGWLQLNDRIVSANGISLERAEYASAVQIMKESEQLNLVVKRRVPIQTMAFDQRTLKFTLTKSKRKDDFGVVLGCKFYIKGITNKKLAEKEPGLKDGDVVLRINGQDCDEMSLSEARKLLEKSKERLSLVVQRDVPRGSAWKWPSQTTLYERLGPNDTPRQSPVPRSPMIGGRCTDTDTLRLNNAVRLSGRYGRLTSSEYGASPKRHSCGSQPPSRSRTPSQSVYDDYNNFSPRGSLPQTPPPRLTTPNGDDHISVAQVAESPILHKPPLPSPQSDARFITFLKEGGSVGVRVIGGNEVGIFVSAVQSGSPAAVKGVRPGDKILRVNSKDMRGVTREEAVLYLLGLQDQVDLVVQHRKDEYERIRSQNLGDNFYIRSHFEYEKPEKGELSFRKGDIFQITDTLFSGTVGSWQAIRVSSPSVEEKSEGVKGVIPNATRAEQLFNAEIVRASRATSTDTRSLLRKKVSLTRRSKSLTKGHWDEVVFAHGAVNFPAYERVKLKHPGFLRPVILFGPLADIAREQLLQDFPLRFAAPHPDSSAPTANGNASDASSGIIRLSAIRDVMNKNKHCVLDITPSSVEKLQYAQYCPIVININVDSRSRLRDLRKKHSKASATKSTKKLQEQAAKIQKMYSYLFTAVLDASHEDRWFEALRELISHLQERRVWMAESRPSDLLDDDFLFPMANHRASGNYAGDSDLDSLRGDGDYGSLSNSNPPNDYSSEATSYTSQRMLMNERNLQNPYDMNNDRGCDYGHAGVDTYANRDMLIGHIATLRRPDASRRMKPKPPPRYAHYPVIPPKPQFCSISNGAGAVNSVADTNGGLLTNGSSIAHHLPVDYVNDPAPAANLHAINECSDMPAFTTAAYHQQMYHPPSSRNGRHSSEPGFYDVKQILESHADDYTNRPMPTRFDRMSTSNGSSSSASYETTPRYHVGNTLHQSYPQPYSPLTSSHRLPMSAGRAIPSQTLPHQNGLPPSHPVYEDRNRINMANFAGSPVQRGTPISRTSSMPSNGPSVGQIGRFSQMAPMSLLGYQKYSSSQTGNSVPPPAPAPRSPHPHSPRVPAQTSIRFADDEGNYGALPPMVNGNGHAEHGSPKENNATDAKRNADICQEPRAVPTERTNGDLPSAAKRTELVNGKDWISRNTDDNSAFDRYDETKILDNNGSNGTGSDADEPTDPHDTHSVLAHVSAFVGPEGGTLNSESTGVSITIPAGALNSKQELFFKVLRDSTISPPLDETKGEALLSPLLMCGPPGLKFLKPVELKLPHCASGVNSERWSFVLKSANATCDGMPSWRQVALNDIKGSQSGQITDQYVSILIDHF